jgi:prepilin signal peptidase PulO-like enzyme (type II secretory pathway)
MQVAITVLIAAAGLIVGSFLNVVVLRLHAGKQFVKGHSECPNCHHVLGPLELIPVVSWLLLRGRCRHCHKPISPQYPLVELATAALFVAAYLTQPHHDVANVVVLLIWLYIIASFIVLTVYDLRWYLLPDKVLLPLLVPAAAICLGEALHHHSGALLLHTITASVLFGGFFYLLALVSKGRWMGGGDIKLAFVMGLLLGLQKTALAMFVAFDVAALVGVGLILVHRKKSSDLIPFGPFLMGGTLVAYYWGSPLIHWYLQASAF